MRLPDLFDPPASPPGSPGPPRRAAKSAEAFRTISEVAGDLEVPQHVLRFWESKFPQIKPMKRAGGRRYYRPDDVALLRRIRQCLYDQCYTIKGVQKLLREGTLKLGETPLRAPTAAAPAMPVRAAKSEGKSEGKTDAMRQALLDLRRELVALRDALAKRRR
jgi:DNA-binding transcriptional MerR regulator